MKIEKINFVIQSILIAVLLFFIFAMMLDKGFMVWILFLYMAIGFIQYLSAWLLRVYFPEDKVLKKYLLTASTMVAVSILAVMAPQNLPFQREIQRTVIFILPWAVAVYYWYMTFRGFFYRFFKKPLFQ